MQFFRRKKEGAHVEETLLGLIHLETGHDSDGIVTACGPADAQQDLKTTRIPANTTCPQCRRNPLYNWSLPIAIRSTEARRFA